MKICATIFYVAVFCGKVKTRYIVMNFFVLQIILFIMELFLIQYGLYQSFIIAYITKNSMYGERIKVFS